MKEIWRDVVGYEGYYQVSNLGRVRGLDRPRENGRGMNRGRILKPQYNKGYTFVHLWKDASHKQHQIHTLVMTAFIGPPDHGQQVNHKNGIHDDNNLSNLEWCTQAENNLHAFRVLGKEPTCVRGSDNWYSKLTESDVLEIRRLRKLDPKKWTLPAIGKEFGIVKSHVKRIVDRQSWSHVR